MEIVILWLLFSVIVGALGASRKIGFFGAFFISLLLSPLIGLIVTLFSKDKQTDRLEKMLLKKEKDVDRPATMTATEFENLQKAREQGLIKEEDYDAILRKHNAIVK